MSNIARQRARRNLLRRAEDTDSCEGYLGTGVVAGIAIGCFIAGLLTCAIAFLSYRVCRARKVKQVTPASIPYPTLGPQYFSHNGHHWAASSSNPSLLLPVRHPSTPASPSQASLGQFTRNQASSRLASSNSSEPRSQCSRAREKRRHHAGPVSASTGTTTESSNRQDVEELKQQINSIKEQIRWMKKTRKGTEGQPSNHGHV